MSLLRRAARRLRLGQYRFHQGDDLEGREYFETLDGNGPSPVTHCSGSRAQYRDGRSASCATLDERAASRTNTSANRCRCNGRAGSVIRGAIRLHSMCVASLPLLKLIVPQELTADLARKQRVATNVARLAEQYRLEKARQPQLPPAAAPSPAPVATPTVPPDPVELPSETARRRAVAERRAAAAQARADSSAPPAADAPAAVGGDAFQPQAWAPQARRRGRSAAS